jgi:tRNA dimethylallyltransferase
MVADMATDAEITGRILKKYKLLVLLGPTASGKTGLAVALARRIGAEIISADSRQVYRDMDLGTGKDLAEYSRGGPPVPCHLIDILDPTEEYSVFTFQKLFYRTFQEITDRGNIPLLVGGTGLYLDAVLRGYRLPEVPENPALRRELEGEPMAALRDRLLSLGPVMHNTTDLRERHRMVRAIEIAEHMHRIAEGQGAPIPLSYLVMGIRCDRKALRRRIAERLTARLAAGMVEEVTALHQRGIPWEKIDSFGLEYRYVGRYLQGALTYEAMVETLTTRIGQFAKRQETWFRGMERKGVRIHWVEEPTADKVLSLMDGLVG